MLKSSIEEGFIVLFILLHRGAVPLLYLEEELFC